MNQNDYKNDSIRAEFSRISGGAKVLIEKCKFLNYATKNIESISYEQFFALISNLKKFDDSYELMHDLTRQRIMTYNKSKTDYYID